MAECCFSTPRIIMQRCSASRMTATPCGLMASVMASAIWRVRRSCTCRRRAKTSTSAGDFAEADDLAVRDVGYVRLAEERQQVVLAHGVELDVLDDDHLVVVDVEEGFVEDGVDVHAYSRG